MKIIIAILVPILVGIVVGSNLSLAITTVILNQPTVTLPIGVWLSIAIGAGLLSSSLIQLAILIDRRLSKRHIRQLQSRLQQSDEDIFRYTSSIPTPEKPSTAKSAPSNPKTSKFASFRFGKGDTVDTKSTTKFANTPSVQTIEIDDDDDWAVESGSNRQLEWEDSPPPRQQKFQSPYSRLPIEQVQIIESEPEQIRREVYDADFRLIQPPYKEPVETEAEDDRESDNFEYTEIDDAVDFGIPSSAVKPPSPHRTTASQNLDDEDWGFDFEDRDTPVKAK
jgi:hypothetical protein